MCINSVFVKLQTGDLFRVYMLNCNQVGSSSPRDPEGIQWVLTIGE